MPLILRVNDGKRQELFFICVTSVTIYPPAECQITIQSGNNCPSPLRAVTMLRVFDTPSLEVKRLDSTVPEAEMMNFCCMRIPIVNS